MWFDKVYYWSWVEHRKERDASGHFIEPLPPVPCEKRLDYVTINGGGLTEFKLAIGVWNGARYIPFNRAELERTIRCH